MPALLAWLAGALASFFSSTAGRIVALKIVLTTLLVIVLPIVLNNVFYAIAEKLLITAYQRLADVDVMGGQLPLVRLSGLAAYFASLLRLPEALSIIMSCLSIKVTLRLIPFVRVVN